MNLGIIEISVKRVDSFLLKANLVHFDFTINRITNVDLKNWISRFNPIVSGV